MNRLAGRLAGPALACAAVLLTLAGAELFLRLTGFGIPPPLVWEPRPWVADPVTSYRLRPDHTTVLQCPGIFNVSIRTNSLGLRGDEIAPRRPGEFRILVVGDSFVFGYGVEEDESFPARLEGILRERERPVSVINGGVPAFDLLQLNALLPELLPRADPDLVLAAVFPWNDVMDYDDPPERVGLDEEAGRLRYRPATSAREWLKRRVHVVRLSARAWGRMRDRALGRPLPNPYDFLLRDPPPHVLRMWDVSAREIARMQRSATERGARFAAIHVPCREQVRPDSWVETLQSLNLDSTRYDLEAPSRLLSERAAALGFELIDLLPSLRRAAAGRELYIPRDLHWTPAGNAVVASAIAESLSGRTGTSGARAAP